MSHSREELESLLADASSLLDELDRAELDETPSNDRDSDLADEVRRRRLQSLQAKSGEVRDGTVVINVADDAMSVSATFRPPTGTGAPITADAVHQILRDSGVQAGIDERVIADAVLVATPNTRK